jgi:hypothetical protein
MNGLPDSNPAAKGYFSPSASTSRLGPGSDPEFDSTFGFVSPPASTSQQSELPNKPAYTLSYKQYL